jgi:hypothetical protein
MTFNTGAPTILTMTTNVSKMVVINEQVDKPLISGWPWATNAPTSTKYPFYMYSGSNSMLSSSYPYIDRPIPSGGMDVFNFSIFMAPKDTVYTEIVSDYIMVYLSSKMTYIKAI